MLKFFVENSAKATHIFSAKNIRILYIESAKTVNKMTLNELVKLTTLLTNGAQNFLIEKSALSRVMAQIYQQILYISFRRCICTTIYLPLICFLGEPAKDWVPVS